MECWGANGGPKPQASGSSSPGIGGYTSGVITLKRTIYVYVGSVGTNSNTRNNNAGGWNGGGYGGSNCRSEYEDAGSGGGGATDFRITNGTWSNITSLRSRIMVAAGGGGCCYPSHQTNVCSGGYGGGLTGGSGLATWSSYTSTIPTGGGQDSPGLSKETGFNGDFGFANQTVLTGEQSYGGGGGGGWYGGGKGCGHGGAGGSSFISGMTGCNGIDSSTGAHRSASQPSVIDGVTYTFNSPVMYAGNSASRPTNPGGNDGYAKITSQ